MKVTQRCSGYQQKSKDLGWSAQESDLRHARGRRGLAMGSMIWGDKREMCCRLTGACHLVYKSSHAVGAGDWQASGKRADLRPNLSDGDAPTRNVNSCTTGRGTAMGLISPAILTIGRGRAGATLHVGEIGRIRVWLRALHRRLPVRATCIEAKSEIGERSHGATGLRDSACEWAAVACLRR